MAFIVIVDLIWIAWSITSFFWGMRNRWDILEGHTVTATMFESEMKGPANTFRNFNASYLYEIDGSLYGDTVSPWDVRDYRQFVEDHPSTSDITIYISRKTPEFHCLKLPESRMDLFYLKSFRPQIILFLFVNIGMGIGMMTSPSEYTWLDGL